MSNSGLYFTGSCENVRMLYCSPGTKLIDPCACNKYYQCNVGYVVNNLTCPTGTAYDHISESTTCNTWQHVIHNGICIEDSPWLRCNFTKSSVSPQQQYAFLQSRCMSGNFTFFVTAASQTGGNDTEDSSDTSAIVGGIMGALILLLLVVIVVILWRRNYFEKVETHIRKSFKSKKSVQNPEYTFRDGSNGIIHVEEAYSTINDAMNDPTYNPNPRPPTGRPLPNRPGGISDQDSFYVEPNKGGPVIGIDNPALQLDKDDEVSPQYTELTSSARASAFASSGTATDDLNSTPYDNSWGGS